jgi:hypothetical protein
MKQIGDKLGEKKQLRDKQTNKQRTNPVAWVNERTIQIDRPPLVGEVNADFCG